MTGEEYNRGVTSIKFLAKTEEGQRAFKFIMEQCGIYDTYASPSDAQVAYYNGRRSIAIQLKDLLGDENFFKVMQTKL